MKLKALRQAVIDQLKQDMPRLSAVDAHPGRFNLEELKRIATQLPAIRVAFMGCPQLKQIETREKEAVVRMAAFIMTGDRRGLPKDEAALALVEALLVLIPYQSWGIKGVLGAANVKADNLFSGQVERQGVAMWAVTWEQSVRLGKNVWGGGILPSTVYVCDDSAHFGDEKAYDKVSSDDK
ncbi:phage protein Gp37 [Candidatus Williamhamiltonella defendens]|uniref:Uncharacterized protein n=1 Tax=Candidatus Hamiltonella defensa (Bemisia tabaci) TaxID=672795 RepID=A0A249DYL3_9ENTR|nr:phage protein Gp37 [Candidatus Hamiltonella defensa]ASX25872.1 hypothetical protein BA171_01625 [Candidatus Hamiltonella defensa (Bemisia tabaci)]